MKIVIVGCGKVGKSLLENLSAEGHDCIIIDKNAALVNDALNRYNVMGIVGNGAAVDVQREAEVEKADLVISVTPFDELNMLCCTIARQLGAKYTVTRVRDSAYSSHVGFIQDKLGFNYAINPDLETAQELASMLSIPAALPSESFWNRAANLVEIEVEADSLFDNLQINDSSKLGAKFLICAVERDSQVYIPNGNFVVKAGDIIYLIASLTELTRLFKKLGIYKDKPRNVVIVGGSHIAQYLGVILRETGMGVKIIEQNRERCLELAEQLPAASIVCGNGSDQSLLDAEGIGYADSFISLTNFDELNMILTLFVKKNNPNCKTICKVSHDGFLELFRGLETDSAISPKEITANHILRYVRAMNNSFNTNSVKTLYRIVGNRVDAAEFFVPENNYLVGKCLKDVKCKDDVLIGCIKRDNKILIPNGDDSLCAGDNIIVVSKEHFKDLSEIYIKD